MSIYTNDNVNYSFRKEPDAGKPHVRNSVRGHDRKECTYSTNEEVTVWLLEKLSGGIKWEQ